MAITMSIPASASTAYRTMGSSPHSVGASVVKPAIRDATIPTTAIAPMM